MNLGQRLHDQNLKGALEILSSLPKSKYGIPRYARNKEVAKWQAVAWILGQELKRLAPTVIGDP